MIGLGRRKKAGQAPCTRAETYKSCMSWRRGRELTFSEQLAAPSRLAIHDGESDKSCSDPEVRNRLEQHIGRKSDGRRIHVATQSCASVGGLTIADAPIGRRQQSGSRREFRGQGTAHLVKSPRIRRSDRNLKTADNYAYGVGRDQDEVRGGSATHAGASKRR